MMHFTRFHGIPLPLFLSVFYYIIRMNCPVIPLVPGTGQRIALSGMLFIPIPGVPQFF
jgi:hypothetical protein